MAISSCVKCGQQPARFELKEVEPVGSTKRFWAFQCASCGGVVGVTEFYNAGALLQKIIKHFKIQ